MCRRAQWALSFVRQGSAVKSFGPRFEAIKLEP